MTAVPRARARAIVATLKRRYPHAHTSLRARTAWEFLVAVMLSAQSTDKKVNEVTPALFRRYRTLGAYATASPREVARTIRSVGLAPSKAAHIVAAARIVRDRFHGKVPRTVAELVSLPGVGRKTANVVLGNWFRIPSGIAVDTHVLRLARAFGLTSARTPVGVERDLKALVPKKDWVLLTHLFIAYGREFPARLRSHRGEPLERFYI